MPSCAGRDARQRAKYSPRSVGDAGCLASNGLLAPTLPAPVERRVRAAGLEHRSPYALRHTYATFAIAAGVSLFELARFMGTSVEQIDRTYGHLLPDALDRTRQALDSFVTAGRVGNADEIVTR